METDSKTYSDESLDSLAASEDRQLRRRCRLPRTQTAVEAKRICARDERTASLKKVSVILQKSECERTSEESRVLSECSDAVEELKMRRRKRDEVKRRQEEFEDSPEVLQQKCLILAQAIAQSQHLVVYTGAGISTAAKIPDYRGPNGIWTRLQQGKEIGDHDLSLAEPTYTHMALSQLYRRKILKYVVSQNCDGLHLRSGLPRTALSELHGNMYMEVCKKCRPHRVYWRLFDVTENTARYQHKTSRLCYNCNEPLVDTIVHFGERGNLQWPTNWSGACKNAEKATTIVCLGSSLKVLKKYPWLWQMDKPAKKRPNLYIINLQWTPKDDVANVKINGRCDHVMRSVMEMLGLDVASYDKRRDPIFIHCSPLNELELHTTSQPSLQLPTSSSAVTVSTRSSSFTIDALLQPDDLEDDDAASSRFLEDYQNSFLQYQLLAPYDLFCYPYRTSFVYSGLHSIIAPGLQQMVPKARPECSYCDREYDSQDCVFYLPEEPVFVEQKTRYSKVEKREKANVCVCCDYSTEEEDDSTTIECKETIETKGTRTQAGWFGKGYKKNRRFKRK